MRNTYYWVSNRLFRKGKKDEGYALLATIILMSLLVGAAYMALGATTATIKNAGLSRSHIDSGQLADLAVQDALYRLNEGSNSGLPTTLATAVKGTANGGTWRWYVAPITNANAGKATTIYAEGTHGTSTRRVEIKAGAPRVGGFTAVNGMDVQYELSPTTAWAHLAVGRDITIQNGAGVGAADTFAKGIIGVLADKADVSAKSGEPSKTAVTYNLYGRDAAKLNVPNPVKAPLGLTLDQKFVTENMSRCGTGGEDWLASRNGGILVADNNVGCYASMTFDVPTTIRGTGSYSAFVKGNVAFAEGLTVANTGALNIYTNGDVAFNTQATATTVMDLKNTYIYAPAGTCETKPFRSTTKTLTLTGALACNKISVAGTFTHKAPIGVLGAETYMNDVWYLTDYQQPSGSRG